MTTLEPIPARLAALKTTPTPDLKAQWRELFDSEPPPFNRRYLESRLAYRIQELAYGGLKPETIRRLERLGEELDGGDMKKRGIRLDRDRPITGTRLLREWQGVEYIVTVTADGFEWQGRPYKSLSAIARAITGNRNAKPDVAGDRPTLIAIADIVAHEGTALGQDLVDMPICLLHGIEHLVDEGTVDVLVEQVAHRVHEDHPRLLPERGLFQPRRPERQVKSLLIGVARNAAPALCKAFSIAVVTSRADLGAAGHRVPCRVRPFDL